jgi:transcriptional regulator with XRE-family HTH domain
MYQSTIGDRVKWLIEQKGLSQNKLASILGISGASVSAIIKGRNNPDFKFIQNILKHYQNLNPDWLIHGEGSVYKTENLGDDVVAMEPPAAYYPSIKSPGELLDFKLDWMEKQIKDLVQQVNQLQKA